MKRLLLAALLALQIGALANVGSVVASADAPWPECLPCPDTK
jgi:hypothetical protein